MIDYFKTQKIIHWLMAIMIMLDLNVAQKFGGDHATAGLIVTFLFILRMILRYRYGAPELPATMPKWQVISAKAGHYGLYILMAGLIITGIISASFASDTIMIFGSYDLAFFTHNENLFSIIRNVHEFCTNAIIALIIIHILAALYHHFVVKDQTTLNMTKFWTSKTQTD